MSIENIKILIVDDSVIYRNQIKTALNKIKGVEVIGFSSNGRLAIERLKSGGVDLIILDLEMPEMDGIATLKEMTRLGIKCKSIVFSSFSKKGAEITIEALNLGATDFVAKPNGSENENKSPIIIIKDLFEEKIKAISGGGRSVELGPPELDIKNFPKIIDGLFKPEIIIIGASTGGPTVLENIFSKLDKPLRCPIVIVQHMPPLFTKTFAERIAKLSGVKTVEASDGELMMPNNIYIAPGDYHLSLNEVNGEIVFKLDQTEKIHSVRPAIDRLFQTAAEIYTDKCLGIILTGMGEDGALGASIVKEHGGMILIQEKSTCVVFGMPGAVYEKKAYDKMLTPEKITTFINEKIRV